MTKARAGRVALRVARKNTKILNNLEYHTNLTTIGDTTPTTVAVFQHLSATTEGDDEGNRHGRKVAPFSIRIKGTCVIHESATSSTFRMIVFKDRMNQGTLQVIGDLFGSEGNFNAGTNKLGTAEVASRFQILYDKTFLLSDNGQKWARIDKYIKLSGNIYYTGTAATDEGKNSIFCMTGSNEATNTPTLTANSVFKWTDI